MNLKLLYNRIADLRERETSVLRSRRRAHSKTLWRVSIDVKAVDPIQLKKALLHVIHAIERAHVDRPDESGMENWEASAQGRMRDDGEDKLGYKAIFTAQFPSKSEWDAYIHGLWRK